MRVASRSRICWISIRRSPLDRPLIFVPLRFLRLLVLLELEIVIFPPAPGWTPSRSESSWEVFATSIVAVVGFMLVGLTSLPTLFEDTTLVDKVGDLTVVVVVPLVVDGIGNLAVAVVVLVVLDVGDLTLALAVLDVLVVVARVAGGGGGSSNAGALLSG
jgi:hypothetical protein